MFEDDLPAFANTRSPRVAAGLGTIARIVNNGTEILCRQAALRRRAGAQSTAYYKPYHAALRQLVERTRERFGFCILLDCHSMPSVGGPLDRDHGQARVDFVLGDCFGTACAPCITEIADRS